MIINKLKKLKPDARPVKVAPPKLSFTALTAREALPELGADEDRREAMSPSGPSTSPNARLFRRRLLPTQAWTSILPLLNCLAKGPRLRPRNARW